MNTFKTISAFAAITAAILLPFQHSDAETQKPFAYCDYAHSIAIDDEYVWIGGQFGLSGLNKKTFAEIHHHTSGKYCEHVFSVLAHPSGHAIGHIERNPVQNLIAFDPKVNFSKNIVLSPDVPHAYDYVFAYGNGIWFATPEHIRHEKNLKIDDTLNRWDIECDVYQLPRPFPRMPNLAGHDEHGYSGHLNRMGMSYDESTATLWYGGSDIFGCINEKEGLKDIPTDGLFIYGLYASPTGEIWLATKTGVWIYSGNSFRQIFTSAEGAFFCISGRDGVIWCSDYNNLHKIEKDDDNPDGYKTTSLDVRNYDFNDNWLIDFVSTLAIDKDGSVWFTLKSSGLRRLVDGRIETIISDTSGIEDIDDKTSSDDLPMYDLFGRRITQPAKGQIYIQGGKKHIKH